MTFKVAGGSGRRYAVSALRETRKCVTCRERRWRLVGRLVNYSCAAVLPDVCSMAIESRICFVCWRQSRRPNLLHSQYACQAANRYNFGSTGMRSDYTYFRKSGRKDDMTSIIPVIELNDGNCIPQLGFGVFKFNPAETVGAVKSALRAGYRHIDTAQSYGNEAGVGQGISESGLDRADVFVTSKLSNSFHRADDARRSFDKTLAALGSDYVDLFLIHWPLPTLYDGDFVSTWNVLEGFAKEGRARSIGVSNFQPEHLDRLAQGSTIVPAVNQIEVHPYFTNAAVRLYGKAHGIVTEAWSPIAKGRILQEPVITQIARARGKSSAQVVLRWHIQRGDVVFPKTASRQRMKSNIELFDFELSYSDMGALSALDRGANGRIGPNPDTFDEITEERND